MPIHPAELAAQKSERDFTRLCAAIDKHILEYEKAGPIRFKLHPNTEPSLVNRVTAAYMDKSWAVNKTNNGAGDDFLEFSTREQALGVPMSAEEILDNATNKLTLIQWNIQRSSLLPTQYEVAICGQIVSDAFSQPNKDVECASNISISIQTRAATARTAALEAVSKLKQLVSFIPDITVFNPQPSSGPDAPKAKQA